MNPSCDLNLENIKAYLKTSTILIAGGAGSIGSELAVQVCRIGCEKLILADIDENSLQELRQRFNDCGVPEVVEMHVADLKNPSAVRNVFKSKPNIVFNCAAHKHVLVGEIDPSKWYITI